MTNMNNILDNAGRFQGIFEAGKDWADEIRDLQQILEGPNSIRTISAIAGLCLSAGSILTTLKLWRLITDTPTLILGMYTGVFGVAIFANEVKSGASPRLDSLRYWVSKWFPFLSVIAGKGFFLVFVGLMGLAFHGDWEVAIPGAVLTACGSVYLITYYWKKEEVDSAIEKSMHIQATSQYRRISHS